MYAILFSLLLLILFAGLYVGAYRVGISGPVCRAPEAAGRKRPIRARLGGVWKKQGKSAVVFVLFTVLGFVLCAWTLRQNQFVYYWDYGGYWTHSYTFLRSMLADPSRSVTELYESILNSEYNDLLPALLAFPLHVIGTSFTRYVLINYLLFFVPAAFVLCGILNKMAVRSGWATGAGTAMIIPLIPFCFPVFYLAMLRGYVDVACLTPAALSLLLMMDYDPVSLDRRQILRDVLISLLLLTTFLFRRYFAFFVFGYGIALTALSVYAMVTRRHGARWRLCFGKKTLSLPKRWVAPWLNLLLIGGVALVILLVFFRPLLMTLLNNSYAQQYAGYDAPLATKLQNLVEVFGWLILLLAAAGLAFSLKRKTCRRVALFCAVSGVTSATAFYTVQDMDIHHVYIVSLPAFLLFAMGIAFLSFLPRRRAAARSVAALLIALSVLNTAHVLIPALRPALSPVSAVFSKTHDPLRRDDLAELHALADQLNRLTEGTDRHVYVCASGPSLNFSILESLDKPDADCAVRNLMVSSDVDLRDGFPTQFFLADLVVVTDPVDLHLAEGTQEVVRYLAAQVMDAGSSLGRHFTRVSEGFALDGGKTAYIYRKISDPEREDVLSLAAYFEDLYPDHPELFADRIRSTLS